MSINLNESFLVKFVEREFTESTMDGKLFFRRNGYFIDLENIQLEKGIGDKAEGKWSRRINPETHRVVLTDMDNNIIPLVMKDAVYRQTFSEVSNLPICCFTVLNLERDFDIDLENGRATLKSELQDELISQFGGRDLILFKNTNTDNFIIDRMKIASKREGFEYMGSKVKYYDDKNEDHPMTKEEYEAEPYKGLFYKRKFFEFQREYRFLLNKIEDEAYILDIGDIRDIAINLGEVKKGQELFQLTIQQQEQDSINT